MTRAIRAKPIRCSTTPRAMLRVQAWPKHHKLWRLRLSRSLTSNPPTHSQRTSRKPKKLKRTRQRALLKSKRPPVFPSKPQKTWKRPMTLRSRRKCPRRVKAPVRKNQMLNKLRYQRAASNRSSPYPRQPHPSSQIHRPSLPTTSAHRTQATTSTIVSTRIT